jgi:hypothetical protein
VLLNQGLLGSAFFEASASVILLVLFAIFRRDHDSYYFRLWLVGWICFTCASLGEVALLVRNLPELGVPVLLGHAAALAFFVLSVIDLTAVPEYRRWPVISAVGLSLVWTYYIEQTGSRGNVWAHWETAILESAVCLTAGWLVWRWAADRPGHGMRLLAGLFLLDGLHGIDRAYWPQHPLFTLRVAFDHLLGVSLGIAMVVLVLESARSRTD